MSMRIEDLLLWGGVIVVIGGVAYYFISKGGLPIPGLPSTGGGTGDTGDGAPTGTAGADRWGIKKLYPSVGREWYNKWDNGKAREWVSKGISQRNADPDDPELDLHANTNGSKCTVDGKGKLVMEGGNPRLYVNADGKKWQNVEMTVYFKALKEDSRGSIKVYSRLAARSEHQLEYKCGGSGRTMGAFEIKASGDMQIRREWFHDSYAPNVVSAVKSPPKGVRWGMKYVLRNKGDTIVSQGYIDTTDGKNGGDWRQVVERIETGPPAPDNPDLCHKLPSMNSIWLRPATSCYLRCDGMFVEYDSFSIREIAPA